MEKVFNFLCLIFDFFFFLMDFQRGGFAQQGFVTGHS